MKRTYLMTAAIALVALTMTACGGTEETVVEGPVTYSLDANATKLAWKGDHTDGHAHNGTVKITEGTIVYDGDKFESGEFTVDLATIASEDLPSPDKDTLDKHLMGGYFFNTTLFPTAKITLKSVTEKEVKAVVNVLGKDMDVTLPISMKKTADKLTAKGSFSIDFAALALGGMQPLGMDPKNPDAKVNSAVKFELNLVLNAAEVTAE